MGKYLVNSTLLKDGKIYKEGEIIELPECLSTNTLLGYKTISPCPEEATTATIKKGKKS